MKTVNYFLTIIFLISLTSIVNAQDRQLDDWRLREKLPVTSDELVIYHLEKMQNDFLGNKNVLIQQINKEPLDYYAMDTYLFQVWDETVWRDSVRGDYIYNAQGWLTEVLYENWSGVWINSSHYTYTYTGYGYVATEIYQYWDGSKWENYSRTTYTYNSNNKKTQYTVENWNGSTWVNNYQSLYEYYPNGNLEKEIVQIWWGIWENYTQYLYEYNSNDLVTELLIQYWSAGAWLNVGKQNYTYNSNSDYLTIVHYVWSNAMWLNDYQELYTYNVNSLLTDLVFQDWDPLTGWINDYKDMYTYDGVGNRTQELYQDWDGSQWFNDYKCTNAYNSNGNLIECTEEDWNVGTGWEYAEHFSGGYDIHGNCISEEYQYWDGTEWVNNYRNAYTWVFFVSGVESEGVVKEFSLENNYPNPFNPSTTIKFQIPEISFISLKVYDILGNEVAVLMNEEKQMGEYSIEFNPIDLPTGVYLFQLKSNSFIETKKMMMLK
jgi:hypothetical protein